MEVTNGEIYTARGSLQIMVGMKLPVKVSFQVAKLAVKLSEPFGVVETVKNGLIRTYGVEDEYKNVEIIAPNDLRGRPVSPNWEKYASEFDELMAQTQELEIEKIQLPSMIDGKPLQIEPSILIALGKFISVV